MVNVLSDVRARRSVTAVDQLLEQAVEALVVIVPHETRAAARRSRSRLDLPVVVVEGDLSRDAADRRRRQRRRAPGWPPRTCCRPRPRDGRAPRRARRAGPRRTRAGTAGAPSWRPGPPGPAAALGRRLERRAAATRPAASLARETDVTAVFVANDQMALGLLRGAARGGPPGARGRQRRRLRRPARGARSSLPPLTTVRQDFAELGRRAMDVLQRVLAGEEQPSVDLVPTTLVVRVLHRAPPRPLTQARQAGSECRPHAELSGRRP